MKNYKGFTVLDLLITIGIIVILSTLTIARINIAHEQARMAGARSYAQSTHQSLGAEEQVRWTFESINGNQVIDESGNGINGTFFSAFDDTASPPPVSLGEISGDAITFTGDGTISYDRLAVANPGGWYEAEPFTVSLWVKPSESTVSATNKQWIYHTGNTWDTFIIAIQSTAECSGRTFLWQGRKNNEELFTDHNPAQFPGNFLFTCFGKGSNYVVDTKWHHLLVTFEINEAETEGTITNYLDGVLVESKVFIYDPIASGAASGVFESFNGRVDGHRLGVDGGGFGNPPSSWVAGSFFQGQIDEFNFYKRSLDIAQINSLYAEGLKKHPPFQALSLSNLKF